MLALLIRFLLALRSVSEARASREAEILVLRQQLLVLSRKSRKRVRLRNIDRLILVWLSRLYPSLLDAIIIVKPETLLRWHRRGFRAYWRWKSWRRGGRPRIDRELRALIRRMSKENPTWGAPRIPWRAADARHRRERVDGRTIHDQNWPTAVAGLENVPA
jgi:hypothetical protein